MITYATEIAKKSHTTIMSCNGFKARLASTQRLPDNGRPHGLPPGDPVPVYPDSLGMVRGACVFLLCIIFIIFNHHSIKKSV